MKLNKSMFSLFGSASKFGTLSTLGRVAKTVRAFAQTEVFYCTAGCQEKLQIIYANIRV